MTHEEIRQLALWLKEHQLAGAELQRPGLHLVLKRTQEQASATAPAQQLPEAPLASAAADPLALRTPGLGRLLLTHPQQTEPLVALGSEVVSGQMVALLQVGELLLPVRSAHAGRVAELLVPCGTTLGYGEVFMRLQAL